MLAERIADAINRAKAGRIIADSEELVRDAHATFRQEAYQKAIDLVAQQTAQEEFSPRRSEPGRTWKNKGRQKTTHMTVNGLLELVRTIYWNKQRGTVAPLDQLLGIADDHYSPGVREMACRLSLNVAFVPASENLLRTSHLCIPPSAFRDLVEREGRRVEQAIRGGHYGPDWTAEDCTDQTLITGADGVMVPLVTAEQKKKRRRTEAKNRKEQGRQSTAKPGRPRRGGDGAYKESKIVSFYDPDKAPTYAVGTSGNHVALGRLRLRQRADGIVLRHTDHASQRPRHALGQGQRGGDNGPGQPVLL